MCNNADYISRAVPFDHFGIASLHFPKLISIDAATDARKDSIIFLGKVDLGEFHLIFSTSCPLPSTSSRST